MKHLKILFICLTLFSLSACQTLQNLRDDVGEIFESDLTTNTVVTDRSATLLKNPCPEVEIVDDLSSLSDFSNPRNPSAGNLISRIDLKSAQSTCRLASSSAIVDVKLIFNGKLGAKGRQGTSDKPFFSYPFFVAITSPTGKILAKEIFAASMTYNSGEAVHAYYENLRQVIPIRSKDQAHRYKVLIGFQVTQDQLDYNRTHMVEIGEGASEPEDIMTFE